MVTVLPLEGIFANLSHLALHNKPLALGEPYEPIG